MLAKNRKFNVHVGEHATYSGIEAATAEEAIRMSCKRKDDVVTKVTSDPIYIAGIGIECDGDDIADDAVYGIEVKGTDEKFVDKIRDALALALGGMAVEFAGLRKDGSSDNGRSLQRLVAENGMSVVAM